MPNKFVCGHLVKTRDGTVKKVVLAGGGGTRDCQISHIDMGFDEIHDKLREIFLQDTTERRSKLYDFKMEELDTNKYTTFYDYVQKNSLRFGNCTLLYLCTPEDKEDIGYLPSPEKRRTTQSIQNPSPMITQPIQNPSPMIIQPIQNPSPVKIRIPQIEADSSTPSVVIKTDDSPQRINEPMMDHRIIENLRISSSSNYSFEKSLNEFVDYLRHLIGQYHRESMLVQLFEYICTIYGLSSIILDRLKQHIRSVHEHEKPFYNDGLEKIEKLSRSIKALIELNKMKISHIDQHSIISNSFKQFHQNFNILRDQWINPKTSTRQNTNYSIDPAPSTSFSSSSSSSRYHSETHSRKQTHASSPSRYHSERNSRKRTHTSSPSYRKSTKDDYNENYSLFKNLLKSLDHLLDVLQQRRFTSFYYFVESLIGEIKCCRSTLKLSDHRSLCDAKELINKIEDRFTNRINDEHRHAAPHKIPEQLDYSFNKSLDSIRDLLNSFDQYKSQINNHKRTRTTYHRSSPINEKPIIHKSTEQKTRIHHHDDDQSSETSHSSIGDEVLMKTARDAYEKRPNRSK